MNDLAQLKEKLLALYYLGERRQIMYIVESNPVETMLLMPELVRHDIKLIKEHSAFKYSDEIGLSNYAVHYAMTVLDKGTEGTMLEKIQQDNLKFREEVTPLGANYMNNRIKLVELLAGRDMLALDAAGYESLNAHMKADPSKYVINFLEENVDYISDESILALLFHQYLAVHLATPAEV